MKTFFVIISIIVFFAILLLFLFGKYSQRGTAPGIVDGSLAKCSASPNCVCSEYINDTRHYIDPIENKDIELTDSSILSAIIQEMGGMVQRETDDYVAATFTSRLFGFVDDFEARIDHKYDVIHIRSASRVGYSDGGVNRERAALFKKTYARNIKTSN